MSKPQFDEYLGGSGALPHEAEIRKLIAARANEIAAMNYSIENPQQTKLIFQKLPVHMRRRVMSHNAKRMPRRLREAHTKQMEKSGAPPKVKRPSRKYRRRPQNLLLEYSKRKRNKVWLETHIWHAKRFHMCEKWGYKLANFSNDRGFRASYRAVSRNCMIQDMSYYSCIELKGPEELLTKELRTHCRGDLSFGARMYINGCREGNLVFHRRNGSPLGTTTFSWCPKKEEKRTLWIWVHPAFINHVLEELSSTFGLKKSPKTEDGNKVFTSDECRMELINSLNRFRLRGPLSIAVISNTLRLPETEDLSTEKLHLFESLGSLNSPSQLPRHSILGFTVSDPRFFLPKARKKAVLTHENCRNILKLPESASSSCLWDSETRRNVERTFKSTSEINALRECNLVPGVQDDDGFHQDVIAKVPVILVQYPGADDGEKSTGFSSGLDVILPSRWGLPFWIAFIHRCARPVGLREHRSVVFESLTLDSSEINHPDTPAYAEEAEKMKNEMIEQYFRRPANRRINFTKFGISSPFYCEWRILVEEWVEGGEVKVLRDRKVLQSLNLTLDKIKAGCRSNSRKKLGVQGNFLEEFGESLDQSLLIPVRVTILGKGRPKNFALICLPGEDDLEKCKCGPVEALKNDPFEKKKRLMRMKHKELLKRLRRRRLRMKREGKNVRVLHKDQDYEKIMRSLYLPECRGVRNSCSREVMGYVIHGDFSFTEAKGIGWGYIVLKSLFSLIEDERNTVLIRNVQSRQYRRARLDIIN